VAPLTTTALSSAPAEHAGVASAVNNDVARVGGLIAVALLPVISGITGSSYLHPLALNHGFGTAVTLSGVVVVAGGILAAILIRNPPREAPTGAPVGAVRAAPAAPVACGLEAPPPALAPAGSSPAPPGATMGP
jgi:hypothetical protein